MNQEYTQGFVDKCAEAGVDAEQLVKQAMPIPGVAAGAEGVSTIAQKIMSALRKYKGNVTGSRLHTANMNVIKAQGPDMTYPQLSRAFTARDLATRGMENSRLLTGAGLFGTAAAVNAAQADKPKTLPERLRAAISNK